MGRTGAPALHHGRLDSKIRTRRPNAWAERKNPHASIEQRRETADAIAAFVSLDDKPLENDESAALSQGDPYELAQNPNA